jgi:phenylpyruvate tautomerase PptA (4-oxalocrotonate tautomerase family)
MPWIDLLTPQTVSNKSQEKIKSGLASILMEVIQKEERGLIVTFRASNGFYQAGESTEKSAVVDIRYIGSFPADKKREITRMISALLEKELKSDPEKIYVPFSELSSENWGRKGGNYS